MVYQPSNKPSIKALGKRPENSSQRRMLDSPLRDRDDSATEDNDSTTNCPSRDGVETRQKRVLPSRSRRGGPGIGSCDADTHIIDALRRKGENEPLIPSDSVFVLTTDSSMLPSTSTQELGQNLFANERYFDRPEVIKAYREQQDIQTPEYTVLGDDAKVGGRLRARGEEESADLSDAAYERRHRKYETFERRQRLREKEKLKHEHYKLKERIEQLRNMDYSAFLALPEELFIENESTQAEPEKDEDTHPHGSAASEGERRRKIMLDAAQIIEERYRVLLPSEKKTVEKGQGTRTRIATSEEPTVTPEAYENGLEAALVVSGIEDIATSTSKPIKLKIKLPSRQPSVPTSVSSMAVSNFSARTERELDGDIAKRRGTPLGKKQAGTTVIDVPHVEDQDVEMDYQTSAPSPPPHPSPPNGSENVIPDDAVAEAHHGLPFQEELSVSSPVSHRRIRHISLDQSYIGDSVSTHREHHTISADDSFEITLSAEDIEAYFGPPQPWTRRPLPAIVIEARRNSDTPEARKTSRHTLAFGVKLPAALAEIRDFELPEWARIGQEYVPDGAVDDTQLIDDVNENVSYDPAREFHDHIDEDKMDEDQLLQPPPALAGGINVLQMAEFNDTAHPSPASLSDAQALLGLSQVRLRQPLASNGDAKAQ